MKDVGCLWHGYSPSVPQVKVLGSVTDNGDWVFNKPLVNTDKYSVFTLYREGLIILPTSYTLHRDKLVCHIERGHTDET